MIDWWNFCFDTSLYQDCHVDGGDGEEMQGARRTNNWLSLQQTENLRFRNEIYKFPKTGYLPIASHDCLPRYLFHFRRANFFL